MAIASGYEVVNDKGDRAWFDDTTGQLFPMPPKVKVEPGTQLQRGDIERGIKQTENIQMLGLQEEARNVKRTGPPNEARVQEVHSVLTAERPYKVRNDKGDEAMFDPMTGSMTPIQKPRPMGGVSDIDITGGQPKLVPPAPGGSYGLAGAIVSPGTRIPAAISGAVTSAAEDIGKGQAPSIPGMITGAVGGFVSPDIAKVVKSTVRGTAGIFGRKPLKEAASGIYEETKAITKPTATTNTEQEIMRQVATFGRTAPRQSQAVVTDVFDKIAAAKASKKPLTYGEVFNNATQINQEVHSLYQGKFKEAAGELEKLSKSMMDDLAASGPEAKTAVDSYRRAVGAFGGYGGVVQAVRKITGLGVGASTVIAAALKPSTMYVSAPAALLGGVANLMTRLPGGVGEGIAKTLISDPGNISLGAARALAAAINEKAKEY